jgi:uncharacterized protein YndB with AHSA1/START domain
LSALEVGGRLFVRDPETGAEMYAQVIERVDPPHLLVMRTEAGYEITTYALQEEQGGTRLTITHAGYEAAPDEARWNMMEQNAVGFGMMLENVQASIEGKNLPYPGGF